MSQPIKILHVINDLAMGGTEITLCQLLSRTDRTRFEPSVLSLSVADGLGDRIRQLGVPVYAMGMKRPFISPRSISRLIRAVRRIKPELIQGWMYHGNLAAQFAAIFAPR